MDSSIQMSIDARKNAFFNAYEITDQNILNKIEDLFNKINELGKESSNISDFETNFASSPLNQEYINLFTEVAMNSKPKDLTSHDYVEEKSTTDIVLDEVSSDLSYALDDMTHPMRREANQKAMDALRDAPVIGDILYAKQNIDMVNKITGKNKEE